MVLVPRDGMSPGGLLNVLHGIYFRSKQWSKIVSNFTRSLFTLVDTFVVSGTKKKL